jgi:integrin alpha-ps, putative
VALLRTRPILDIFTSVHGNLNNINPNSQGCPEDRLSKLSCFRIEACFKFNSTLDPNYLRLNYTIVAETFADSK